MLEAVQQAEQLKTRAALTEISLPTLPEDLTAVLARTVIAEDAELQVAAHLAAHRMTDHGEAWLAGSMPCIADENARSVTRASKGYLLTEKSFGLS